MNRDGTHDSFDIDREEAEDRERAKESLDLRAVEARFVQGNYGEADALLDLLRVTRAALETIKDEAFEWSDKYASQNVWWDLLKKWEKHAAAVLAQARDK